MYCERKRGYLNMYDINGLRPYEGAILVYSAGQRRTCGC